jgi:hypothetical protein
MLRLLGCMMLLAGCQKTDPLFCGKHPESCNNGNPLDDANAGVSIGGTVTGLSPAMGLLLQNNGGDDLDVNNDGVFVFATNVPIGASYDVKVATEPTKPSEMCTVTNGSGTANADVHEIHVTCMKTAYTVGGTVGGLNSGTSVRLANGADAVTSMNGTFTFPTPVPSGDGYLVSVTTQPANGGPCNVFGGTGTVGNGNVTSVLVNCSASMYAIGGTVNNLNGSVTLANANNGDSVQLSANGSYAFPKLVSGNYSVSVSQQPTYPPESQTCLVANGSGAASGNVTNIDISCATNSFTVGGNISGLSGSVTLQDNGGDDLSSNADGVFTFATPIASGQTYHVTVRHQPSGQTCSVANGGPSTMTSAAVTNVAVTCAANDPGIRCKTNYCSATIEECCDPNAGTPKCQSAFMSCGHPYLQCDDSNDCLLGAVCCVGLDMMDKNFMGSATCSSSCNASHHIILCGDSTYQGPCPSGKTCQPFNAPPGLYYACQ